MKHYFSLAVLLAAATITSIQPADACTGITLTAKDQSKVVARTIEWGGTDLNSQYVIVPRGYTAQSYLPGGSTDGMPKASTKPVFLPASSISRDTVNTRNTIRH